MLWWKGVVLLGFLGLCEVGSCDNQDYLLSNGWIKIRKNGARINVKNVRSLCPPVVPDSTTYLKVAGSSVLQELREETVKSLPALQDLILQSIGIKKIFPGAFSNLPQLSRVNLKGNELRRISKGVFNTLNITELLLNRNKIKIIDSAAFDDMPRLEKIKLNSNSITKWDVNWFKNAPSLRVVLITRNFIEVIPEGALQNIQPSVEEVDDLPNLKLFFSKNKIHHIEPNAFRTRVAIGQLFLDRNNITVLNNRTFEGFKNVSMLNLARNNLTEIPRDLFSDGQTVRKFDLSANRKLHCIPIEVAKVVRTLQLENIDKLNCTCVGELKSHAKVIGLNGACFPLRRNPMLLINQETSDGF
ncbi:leucine-rich repeat-containing protein 70-like [Euwallacea fornicatus]|uniref:leucine-rich repeat-containing protein 70-like n=1 Tax=Euwallacea fornicatus TaxID=995702 RepID=UPI00338EDE5C